MTDLKRVMVMLFYIDGGSIVSKRSGSTNWDIDESPSWDWQHEDFMMAPLKPEVSCDDLQ